MNSISSKAVFWPLVHTRWITLLPCPLSLSVIPRKCLRSVRLGWFPFAFPCGSSIGLGMWRTEVPSPEVINGRKMAAVHCVNPKAFQVEHGCLSSSEKWGKASPNPALKTRVPLCAYSSFSKHLKTEESRNKNRGKQDGEGKQKRRIFFEKTTK